MFTFTQWLENANLQNLSKDVWSRLEPSEREQVQRAIASQDMNPEQAYRFMAQIIQNRPVQGYGPKAPTQNQPNKVGNIQQLSKDAWSRLEPSERGQVQRAIASQDMNPEQAYRFMAQIIQNRPVQGYQ